MAIALYPAVPSCGFAAKASDRLYVESTSTRSIPAKQDFVFAIGSALHGSRVQIINGLAVSSDAKQRDWPATAIAVLGDGTNKGRCTGTLVGPGLVLLAAHCLDVRGQSNLRPAFIQIEGQQLAMRCAIPKAYRQGPSQPAPLPRNSEDFALCFSETLRLSHIVDGVAYETIDLARVAAGAPVLLMGFGCSDIVDADVRDTTFRIGDSSIDKASSGSGAMGGYAEIRTTSQRKAAICEGDSGGPVMTGVTTQAQTLSRRVRGVNSALQPQSWGLLSLLAMLDHTDFEPFAKQWLATIPATFLCGVTHSGTSPCRP